MTLETFEAFYPQFAGFEPAIVAATYVDQANARFSSFGEDAEEARRLYAAHKLTLYAQAAPPGDSVIPGVAPSLDTLAAAGEKRERIASKKVGEVSVSYASSVSSGAGAASGMDDLAETIYGMQLLSLIRMYAMTVYVP